MVSGRIQTYGWRQACFSSVTASLVFKRNWPTKAPPHPFHWNQLATSTINQVPPQRRRRRKAGQGGTPPAPLPPGASPRCRWGGTRWRRRRRQGGAGRLPRLGGGGGLQQGVLSGQASKCATKRTQINAKRNEFVPPPAFNATGWKGTRKPCISPFESPENMWENEREPNWVKSGASHQVLGRQGIRMQHFSISN